jgi:transcriptional regulator PpsR
MNTRERDFWSERSAPRISPEHFNEIVATAADLAIVLDLKGIVQSLVVNPLNPGLGRLDHWEKRDIREFVAEDSLPKVERQLKAYQDGDADSVDSIEVNHFDNANWEFPIRYTMHRTGDKELILMLGRDMRPIAELQTRLVKAQLALEKDYEAHRDFETRYRVVLESARDPFVLVDAGTGRIVDANGAAGLVLGADVEALVGADFSQEFDGKRNAGFIDALINATAQDRSTGLELNTRRTKRAVTVTGILFRSSGEKFLLCRLEGVGSAETVAEDLATILSALYRDGADGVVITDRNGTVRYANDAFLSLCEVAQLSDIKGNSLSDYLIRGSVDVKVMIDNAGHAGKMSVYSTRLEGAFGSVIPVEISVTHLTARADPNFGFVVRDASRMELVRDTAGGSDLPPGIGEGTMQNVMDLVGSAPLKDIVAATTDVVEKMCIETAVELTRNNRVAAAEMLGLSRQSLYVKLRKYGLLNKND